MLQELIVQIHLIARARSGVVNTVAPGSRDPGHRSGDGGADIQSLIAPSLPRGIRFRIK